MSDDIDEFVQVGGKSINRLSSLLEQGEKTELDELSYISLDDAKYVIANTEGNIDVRYHHDKGLDREDIEDIDYIQIGDEEEPIAFDIEPNLGIDTAEVPSGTAAMLLDAACRYEAELESGNPRRNFDFRYMAEDYFENGSDLVTHSPPEGSDSAVGLTIDEGVYTLELPLESAVREVNDEGTSSPRYERLLVFEGKVE